METRGGEKKKKGERAEQYLSPDKRNLPFITYPADGSVHVHTTQHSTARHDTTPRIRTTTAHIHIVYTAVHERRGLKLLRLSPLRYGGGGVLVCDCNIIFVVGWIYTVLYIIYIVYRVKLKEPQSRTSFSRQQHYSQR